MAQTIHDLPVNDTLKDFITKGLWDPEESGWRPFQNAEEAAIIKDETLRMRGCSWIAKAASLGESSGVFNLELSYASEYLRNSEISYEELFQSYKTANGSLPCGLPIEQKRGDRLRIDYINSLPQPLEAETLMGYRWPVETICVQTGLVQCDIGGKIQTYQFEDITHFIDDEGAVHDPGTFEIDHEETKSQP